MWALPRSEIEPCLLHWQADSLPLNHQGSPSPIRCDTCLYSNCYQKFLGDRGISSKTVWVGHITTRHASIKPDLQVHQRPASTTLTTLRAQRPCMLPWSSVCPPVLGPLHTIFPLPGFFFFKNMYFFIWLCLILVASCRIFY